MFRNYNLAMLRAMNLTNNGYAVPRIISNPDRAYANLMKYLKLRKSKKTPLPFLSLGVSSGSPNTEVRLGGNLNQRISVSEDGYNYVGAKRSPMVFRFTYQVDVWARNRLQKEDLMLQFLNLFDEWQQMFIPVDFGELYGTQQNALVEMVDFSDESNYVPGAENLDSRFMATMDVPFGIVHGTDTEVFRAAKEVGITVSVMDEDDTEEVYEFTVED